MRKFVSLFISMVLFPAMMNAQQYEGETNKKGQPNGQGVITFNRSNGGVEKLEGTFEKGMPVKGTSKSFDKYGRLTMEFEGTFKPAKKGIFTKLGDLLAYGNIVFLYYENEKNYASNGFFAKWGTEEGDKFKKSSSFALKRSTRGEIPPEGQKYYDYLFPRYVYHLTKSDADVPYTSLIQVQGDFDVPSVVDQQMEHFTIANICGSVSNNMPNGTVYGLAYKDNDKYQLYYFKGDFENGKLKKINTLKQYVRSDKVRNHYINSEAQKFTPFFSENDFDEYLVIEDKHFSNKERKLSTGATMGSDDINELNRILSQSNNKNNKDMIERAKVICAYKLINQSPYDFDIYKVLKNFPEIANAKGVYASWDGSKKVDIKDAYWDYLRHINETSNDRLYYYNYVYNEWGPMTQEEIFYTEHNYILSQHPNKLNQYYKKYFPNGQYAGKDFYSAWGEAYINNCKMMLKKNDPKLWVDLKDAYSKYNISYFDWLHYPKLSKGIGGYSKNTMLSSLMSSLKDLDLNFNKRKLSLLESFFSTREYIFKCHVPSTRDAFRPDVFDILEEGSVTDEAKTYRALMDAIGAASQIDDDLCTYTTVREGSDNFQRWSACHIVLDYLIEGIKAARKLSASTPEIRPACKKAEEVIKGKINMLNKKVFVNDEAWIAVIRKYNNSYNNDKEAERKTLKEIESLGLPKYKYEDGNWQDDYSDEVYRGICFDDLTGNSCTTIWKAKNGSYYKVATGVFLRTKYRSENDAIIAAYAYLKYNEVRQAGRIR